MIGVLLRQISDHSLGRDEKTGNGSRILQCAAHDFSGVDYALRDEIAISAGLSVEAERIRWVIEDLTDNHRTVLAGVGEDLPCRSLQRSSYNRYAASFTSDSNPEFSPR